MKRKLLILPLLTALLGLSACNQASDSYAQYKRYLANLNGNEPISYVDWLESMKGEQGEDGVAPNISIGNNGHFFIDNEDTGVTAKGVDGVKGETGDQGEKGIKGLQGDQGEKGEKGEKGDNAITPYELYKQKNPDYTKSEDEFYADLANGNSGEQLSHTVSFTYNGSEILVSQSILHGEKATNPGAPYMPGLTFVNWVYQNEAWNFNASVTEDLALVAVFQ